MIFEIVANNLKRNSEIKTLKLQSKEYAVTIFYYGDYEKDVEAGKCSIDNLTVSCKPRGDCFPLSCVAGNVMFTVSAMPYVSITEIDELKSKLDITKESAIELQGILKEYFNMEPSTW